MLPTAELDGPLPAPPGGGRVAAALVRWWPALAAYAWVRAIGLVVGAVLLPHLTTRGAPRSLGHLIGSWDGTWYARIAVHGYDLTTRTDPAALWHASRYAWFPALPGLMDALRWLPGFTPIRAGFAVTLVAGFVAAAGLHELGVGLTGNRRVGTLLAALWAVAPASVVLEMAYSEALFCALAAWTLVALARGRLLTAAVLAAASGLVRSTATALVVAVVVVAALTAVRAPRSAGDRHARALAAACVAPLGLLGYLGFVAWATRRLDGWFWVEDRLTGLPFDWGRDTWHHVTWTVLGRADPVTVLVTVMLGGAAVLLGWGLAERVPAYLRWYTVVVVVMALGSGAYYESKPRFLLPAFLLALPLARLLAPLRRRVLVPLVSVLAAASAWFGVYVMVTANLPP